MSEADKDDSLADATFDSEADDAVDNAADDPPALESDAPQPDVDNKAGNKPKKKGGATASIAWLALFLSLLTVAGVGYLLLEKVRNSGALEESSAAVSAVRDDVDELAGSVSSLQESLQESRQQLASDDASAAADISALRRELDERADLFDSLPSRMSTLERSIAALQGVSIEARNTYLVAEAEYYLQIANAQLQLAGNPYLASLALNQADDRLQQLGDPALIDVRRAIADELAALEVMEKPDIAGVTLILASLARVVDALPLRGAAADDSAERELADEEIGGMARAWAAIKDAASGLVKVTPPDGDRAALITPDVARLARSNLSLQLQAARLALLRGEQQVFEQSLEDADAWLDLYFDTDSEPVRSARETMNEIRSGYASVAAPDISGSLRLLRQYKTLTENAQ